LALKAVWFTFSECWVSKFAVGPVSCRLLDLVKDFLREEIEDFVLVYLVLWSLPAAVFGQLLDSLFVVRSEAVKLLYVCWLVLFKIEKGSGVLFRRMVSITKVVKQICVCFLNVLD